MRPSEPPSVEDILAHRARQHLLFLDCLGKLDFCPHQVSLHSLTRYLNLWLPLVATVANLPKTGQNDANVDLIPPPDIAWLWYCHRLSLSEYRSYCLKNYGNILEARPPLKFQAPGTFTWPTAEINPEGAAFSEALTRALWYHQYPRIPFFLPDSSTDGGEAKVSEITPLVNGFDLLAWARRHSGSNPFSDDDCLRRGVDDYCTIVRSRAPRDRLNPTLSPRSDFIRRTHLVACATADFEPRAGDSDSSQPTSHSRDISDARCGRAEAGSVGGDSSNSLLSCAQENEVDTGLRNGESSLQFPLGSSSFVQRFCCCFARFPLVEGSCQVL